MSGRNHSEGYPFDWDPYATRPYSDQSSLNLPPLIDGNNRDGYSMPNGSHAAPDTVYTNSDRGTYSQNPDTNPRYVNSAGSYYQQGSIPLSQGNYSGAQPTHFDQSMYQQPYQGGPPLFNWPTSHQNPINDTYVQYAQPQVPSMAAYRASYARPVDTGPMYDTTASGEWADSTAPSKPSHSPYAPSLPAPAAMLASQRGTDTTDHTDETEVITRRRRPRTEVACESCRKSRIKCNLSEQDPSNPLSCKTCVCRGSGRKCTYVHVRKTAIYDLTKCRGRWEEIQAERTGAMGTAEEPVWYRS